MRWGLWGLIRSGGEQSLTITVLLAQHYICFSSEPLVQLTEKALSLRPAVDAI